MNCCDVPRTMLGITGVMSMACSTAEVTVRVVPPDFPNKAALMKVEPTVTAEARPLLVPMDAKAGSVELHAACVVRSWTVLSVKIPVAVNCWLLPSAMLGLDGITPIDTSAADVIVRVVLPEIVPDIAVMTAEPGAADVAKPLEPVVLLTATTVEVDELQMAEVVRSSLVPSE